MILNRRTFLTALAAGLAGATLDPERLLWRPGAKTIFLPSPRVVRDPASGISIRLVQHWDTLQAREVNRFDVLWAQPYGFMTYHNGERISA